MKKMFSLLMIMSLFLLLGTIGVSKDMEEARYSKNFLVKKNAIIKIPESTSGKIIYALGKGSYILEIYSLDKESTMYLDDGILDTKFVEHAISAKEIKPGYYKFIVNTKRNAKYKHFYKTTLTKGKLRIKITKQK
jgi:hypothetical protein